MTCCKQAACVLLAIGILATAGCGGSPADDAMQEVYDVMLEAKALEDKGDMAKAMELVARMVEAAQKLEAEVKKMSDEERKAFEQRWAEKFKSAGLEAPEGD